MEFSVDNQVEFSVDNQTNYLPNLYLLKSIAKSVTTKDIELVICYNSYIQELNKQFRQKDTATDVLSFPYENMPFTPIGSIVISLDYVKQKALFFKHSIDDEFYLLFIHGLLHLLGYDHELDNGEHRQKEEELIKKFKLPDSLIVRNI